MISSGYEGQDALNEAAAFIDTWYQGRENWPKTHRLESLAKPPPPDASDLERASAIALRWAYIEGRRNPQDVRPLESNIAAALAEARRAAEIAMQERERNLATLLRRFIWQAEKLVGDSSLKTIAGQARGLMERYGIAGDLLRGDPNHTLTP